MSRLSGEEESCLVVPIPILCRAAQRSTITRSEGVSGAVLVAIPRHRR
jgi:hypothetical protein